MKYLYLLINLLGFAIFSNAQIQWEHTNGPEGGNPFFFQSNNTYAFYSDAYFSYRTSDGINWEKLQQGNLWPMAASDHILASFQGYGLNYGPPDDIQFMVSYDNGLSWQVKNLAPSDKGTLHPLIVCSHGIYGGSGSAIYRTVDDGDSWQSIPIPGLYSYQLVSYKDYIFHKSGNDIYQFDPSSDEWIIMLSNLNETDRLVAAYKKDQNIILATPSKVFASLDNGATWKISSVSSYSHDRKIIELDGRIYTMAGFDRIGYSDDMGLTWQFSNFALDGIYDLCVIGGGILISTYNQGFFRMDTEDFSLESANSGLQSAVVYSLAGFGNTLWAGCSNGLYRFDLLDEQWYSTTVPFPHVAYRYLAVSREGHLACVDYYDDSVYVTKDNGQTWEIIDLEGDYVWDGELSWLDDKLYIYTRSYTIIWKDNTLEYVDVPTQIVYCNGQYFGTKRREIYSTSDSGITWTKLSPNIDEISYVFSSGDRLFAYSTQDFLLYTSSDGIHWEYSGDGLPSGIRMELYLPSDPEFKAWNVEDKFFIDIAGNEFYVSLDTCKTWLPVEKTGGWYEYLNGSFYRGYYGGGVFRTGIPDQYGSIIRGQVFNDVNNNGVKDPDETGVPNAAVQILEPTSFHPFWFTSTDDDGKYIVSVTAGSEDTIRLNLLSDYILSIEPAFYLSNQIDSTYDFAVHYESDITDIGVAGRILGRPRPGFDLSINVTCDNLGTLAGDAYLCLKMDANFEFLMADPPPSMVYPDSLVWSLPSIPMFAHTRIHIQGKLSVDALLGDELRMEAKVTTLLTDSDLSNNVLILADTIVGSFDPNEKRVFPHGGLTRDEVAEGKELEYTIHFQNTGTYLAERVVLSDQLDTTLDWSSFRFIDASHAVTKWELIPGGLLRVEFDQINLPDSISNEPESHGYFSFAIRRNAHSGPYTNCLNTAAIFFDFNHPIITNTTVSRVINPVVVSVNESTFYSQDKNKLLFMPNPSGMNCMISTNQLLKGSGYIKIYHSNGVFVRQIQTQDLESDFLLDTSELPNGMYIITAHGKEGSLSGKLIVLK